MSMRLESLIKLGDVLNGLYGDLEHYEIQDTWNSESKDTWSKLVKNKLTPILDKIRVKQIFYTTDNIIEIKNLLLNIKNTLSKNYNNFNRGFRDERIINNLEKEISILNKLEKSKFETIIQREISNSELDLLMEITSKELEYNNVSIPNDLYELIFNYLNYSETNNIDEIFHYLLSIYNILKNNNQSRALQQINELYENLKIFDQKRLKNDIDIQLKEAKEIAHDVKVSITHTNNNKITQHYYNEADILKLRIKELNNQIISLFILIVFIFLLKLIFRIDSFENIYTFITFLSIILTITGLITYLIKDYNQCKNLYDFYNIRHLELNALPEYMYELTPEQRKDLIIQLAPTYFIGVNDQKHQNTNNIDFSIIDQKLEEITKIVTKLQSLNK